MTHPERLEHAVPPPPRPADNAAPPAPRPANKARAQWMLMWTLPLTMFLGVALWFYAALMVCGIGSACVGGLGASDSKISVLLTIAASGAFAASPLLGLKWTEDRTTRRAAAVVVGLAYAVVGGMIAI